MGAITLEIAQAQLKSWLDASTAAAQGQSYSLDIGGSRRQITRADAVAIQKQIQYWSGMVNRLSNGSSSPSIRLGMPRDF